MSTEPILFATQTGVIAGLITSLCWTFTSVFFTEAGRRVGPTTVNLGRLALAVCFLGLTNTVVTNHLLPNASAGQIWLLAASGVVGLSIGDQALFMAFVYVGPRITTLVMTTAPIVAAAFGWLVLGETFGWLSGVGMVLTVGGVAWVILGRSPTETGQHPPHRVRGIVLASIAAVCQAAGLLLSKAGLGHGWLGPDQHLRPLEGTLIRMSFALMGVLLLFPVLRRQERKKHRASIASMDTGEGLSALSKARVAGFAFIIVGSVTGPFLGVWMSLVAADNAPVGIAQTLLSLPPVLLLPVSWFLYRERFTSRAVLGAVAAVAGVGLLASQAGS